MNNIANNESLTVESRALKIFNYILLIAVVLVITLPIMLVFIISFKSNEEYLASGIFKLPKSFFYLENYATFFTQAKVLRGAKNTLVLMTTSVVGTVLLGTMVAYVLGRFNFRYKKFLLIAFLIPTFIPSITTAIATFTIIKNLHVFNTIYAGIILYLGADIVTIYIFLQFIEKIPYALDESGRIDGASYLRIYWSIILPQMRPAIVTVIIIKGLGVYNDFFIPYMYMPKSSLRTISTTLSSFSSDRSVQWPIMSAGIIVVAVPTLILYIFMQRYIMAGVTDGAVKS